MARSGNPSNARTVLKILVATVFAVVQAVWIQAQSAPEIPPVPAGLRADQLDNLTKRRDALIRQEDALASRAEKQTLQCTNVLARSAQAQSCQQSQIVLERDIQDYLTAVQKYNDAIREAGNGLAEAQREVTREQEEFDRTNRAWLQKQQEFVRQAVERDRNWRAEVLASIQAIRVPNPEQRPKTLYDLKPGDILLIAPDPADLTSTIIPPADQFYRSVVNLTSGEAFRNLSGEAPVSHAAAFVKTAGAKLLFLDHTLEGSRILDDKQFIEKYGHREMYVARPQAVVDGRKLWDAARDAALKQKSDYGLFGQNVVCSERAGIAVAKGAGLPLENNRIGPVDMTPGDFFDRENTGKYFVVSPLK